MTTIKARFDKFPPHPLAFSFPRGGACGMKNGDIVMYMNGRPIRMDEALSDGDALVTLADGSHTILHWNNFIPWPNPKKGCEICEGTGRAFNAIEGEFDTCLHCDKGYVPTVTWTFDDQHIGLSNNGNISITEVKVPRPPALSDHSWYKFASQIVELLNKCNEAGNWR